MHNINIPETQEIVKQMFIDGSSVLQIMRALNLKYDQSLYNLLKREGLYVKRPISDSFRKYPIDQEYFFNIDTEHKAYILGFIVADGSVDFKNKRVKIQLNRQDRDVLEKICVTFNNNIKVTDIMHHGHPHCKVSLNSAVMVNDLMNKGVHPAKSLTMTDEVYKHIPLNLQRHFLRGYFDGDGCLTLGSVYSSGTKYGIDVIGTKDFLEGTFGTYFQTNCKLQKHKSCEMYSWKTSSKQGVIDFLHSIYGDSNIYLDRKYNKFQEYSRTNAPI